MVRANQVPPESSSIISRAVLQVRVQGLPSFRQKCPEGFIGCYTPCDYRICPVTLRSSTASTASRLTYQSARVSGWLDIGTTLEYGLPEPFSGSAVAASIYTTRCPRPILLRSAGPRAREGRQRHSKGRGSYGFPITPRGVVAWTSYHPLSSLSHAAGERSAEVSREPARILRSRPSG